MHERFKRKLAELEKERKQLTEPSFVVAIRFVDRNRTPVEAAVATARDFTCHRNEGEPLEAFEECAIAECHARYPVGMPPILIFSKEASNAART
jgi:hypothetical protein